MRPKALVIVFPGSNCDRDTLWALERAGFRAELVWHQETSFGDAKLVVLPGGFSYGDYLRPGAIARLSPAVLELAEFAERGGLVLGICNGFQILTEAGLLPGALRKNKNLRFICSYVDVVIEDPETPFTILYRRGEKARMPIAHMDGAWWGELGNASVVMRYLGDPNGSLHRIAALYRNNVMGTMPHPERASDPLLGSEDGLRVFLSARKWIEES